MSCYDSGNESKNESSLLTQTAELYLIWDTSRSWVHLQKTTLHLLLDVERRPLLCLVKQTPAARNAT